MYYEIKTSEADFFLLYETFPNTAFFNANENSVFYIFILDIKACVFLF